MEWKWSEDVLTREREEKKFQLPRRLNADEKDATSWFSDPFKTVKKIRLHCLILAYIYKK